MELVTQVQLYIYIYIYVCVCVCVLFGPVKPELGVILSGQKKHLIFFGCFWFISKTHNRMEINL